MKYLRFKFIRRKRSRESLTYVIEIYFSRDCRYLIHRALINFASTEVPCILRSQRRWAINLLRHVESVMRNYLELFWLPPRWKMCWKKKKGKYNNPSFLKRRFSLSVFPEIGSSFDVRWPPLSFRWPFRHLSLARTKNETAPSSEFCDLPVTHVKMPSLAACERTLLVGKGSSRTPVVVLHSN